MFQQVFNLSVSVSEAGGNCAYLFAAVLMEGNLGPQA